MSSFQQTIAPLFIRRLLRSEKGRAFALNQAAIAEGSDEGRIFSELAKMVEDPEIKKLVRIHEADEERHAELFAAAARKGGVPIPELPEELHLLERIDRELGGFFEQFQRGERGIMDIYLLLQVIEERATTQFRVMEPELRRYDEESADVLRGIASDEDRHLKYCRAISRKYAPSEALRKETLDQIRTVEAKAFGEHGRASMKYCLDNHLADIPAYELPFWRGLLALGNWSNLPVPSAFGDMPAPRAPRWSRLGAKAA